MRIETLATVDRFDEIKHERQLNGAEKRRKNRVLMSDDDIRNDVTPLEAIAKAILIFEDYYKRTGKMHNGFDDWRRMEGALMRLKELRDCIEPPPQHEFWFDSLGIYLTEDK